MRAITEQMKVHEAWYEEAAKCTLETLPGFLIKLTTEFKHDYGTICHAVAAAAVAAAWAVEHSPAGGITGFQGGAVMWEFIKHWNHLEDKPLRLVDFSHMLYPQYESHFQKTITPDTWKWLQEEARKNLGEKGGHKEVREHWKMIAMGVVPFGYEVKE